MIGLVDGTQSPNELIKAIDDAIEFANDVHDAPEGSLCLTPHPGAVWKANAWDRPWRGVCAVQEVRGRYGCRYDVLLNEVM